MGKCSFSQLVDMACVTFSAHGKRLNYSEVARALGINQSTFSRQRSGRIPVPESIVSILRDIVAGRRLFVYEGDDVPDWATSNHRGVRVFSVSEVLSADMGEESTKNSG